VHGTFAMVRGRACAAVSRLDRRLRHVPKTLASCEKMQLATPVAHARLQKKQNEVSEDY